MRAAIIGGGFAGGLHAAALRSCGIEPAAIVTTRTESARAFAERWNIPVWSTDTDIALADDIDAVHICTPPSFHADYVRAALLAGKKVFCEKPLGFSSAEAHALADLADSVTQGNLANASVQTDLAQLGTVTFNVRYHMAVQRARELIQGGTFGRPLLIHGSYLQEFHVLPAPYDWRYDEKLSGGMRAVTEIGSHWIDTAQYITGKKVTAVSASFANFFPDRIVKDGMMEAAPGSAAAPDNVSTCSDAGKNSPRTSENARAAENARTSENARPLRVNSEDAACITFRYEDGAMGNVMLSEISPGRGNRLSLEITCENGNLWWNEEENNVLHTALRGQGVHSEIFAFGNGFNDTFVSLMQHFYAGEEVPTFREAAQVVDVCEAIAASAAHDSAWTPVAAR